MTKSQAFKAYTKRGGKLPFGEWLTLAKRLDAARAARSSNPAPVQAPAESKPATDVWTAYKSAVVNDDYLGSFNEFSESFSTPEPEVTFERIGHRVDVLSVKGTTVRIMVDTADVKAISKALKNVTVISQYTSRRGERSTLDVQGKPAAIASKLTGKGFAVKGKIAA